VGDEGGSLATILVGEEEVDDKIVMGSGTPTAEDCALEETAGCTEEMANSALELVAAPAGIEAATDGVTGGDDALKAAISDEA